MQHAKLFAILLPLFLLIDLLWLGVLMKDFYSRELGEMARRQGESLAPRWGAAILVYLLIPGGLVLFVRPQCTAAPWWQVFAWGAVYGLIVYGVYDLTNLSVLERWSVRMALADLAWGTILCGTLALVMRPVDSWLGS